MAVGQELEKQGINVYHIMTPRDYVKKARSLGMDSDRVLWLRKDVGLSAEIDPNEFRLLSAYEEVTGYSAKNFMQMDRFLRFMKPNEALKYVVYAFSRIRQFIEKNNIRVVSGEPTTIHDLLSFMICKATGRDYIAPFQPRLPIDRFVVWDSFLEQRPVITGPEDYDALTEKDIELAVQVKDKVLRKESLGWHYRKSEQPKIGFTFISRLARGLLMRATVNSKYDAHMYTLGTVLFNLKYHMRPINHRLNRLQWDKLFEKPHEGEKFVLFMMSVMPEYTSDVEAPYFLNVIESIKNIARSLPWDTKLYVKEHPNALGIRGPKILRKIKSIPGVRLIDPFVKSHDLFQHAEIVVSLAGTAAMEAAFFGRRSIIFADIYLKNLSTVECTQLVWEVGARMASDPPRAHDPEADLKYVAWLIANSHEGSVVDRISNPETMSPENVSKLAAGYLKAIIALGPKRPALSLDGVSLSRDPEETVRTFCSGVSNSTGTLRPVL